MRLIRQNRFDSLFFLEGNGVDFCSFAVRMEMEIEIDVDLNFSEQLVADGCCSWIKEKLFIVK